MNEPAMTKIMENNLGEVVEDALVTDKNNIYVHIPYIPGYNEERKRDENSKKAGLKKLPLFPFDIKNN